MVKILHISDVHLNAGYSNKNEKVRNKLKVALKIAFSKAIDFAINNNVDGIVIAGDFFDHDKISFEDEQFVYENLDKVLNIGISIFYCSGNHDPMQTTEFLKRLEKYKNFKIYEDDQISYDSCISRDQTPYKVISVGHKSKNEQRNLIKAFPQKNDDTIWIGLAHASVPSALSTTDKLNYMAAPLSDIEKLDYDYFALGHIHIRQLLTPKIGYSGNIQGINIKETGLKGGYLVTINSNGTLVEPVDFNDIIWEQVALEIPGVVNNLTQLQEWIIESIMPTISKCTVPAKNMILRINLTGKTILKSELSQNENLSYLVDYLKNRMGLLEVEIKAIGVSNLINVEELMMENTVLSEALHTIKNLEMENELMQRLLSLPIYSNLESNESKIEYLLELTFGLSDALVERMVVEKNEDK